MDSGHQHFVCDKIGGFWILSSKNTQGVRVKGFSYVPESVIM